jgi:hypothetical protein
VLPVSLEQQNIVKIDVAVSTNPWSFFSLLVESVPGETNAARAGTAPVGSASVDVNCQLNRVVRRPHERLLIPPQVVASAIFRIGSDNLQASALLISYRVDRTPVVNPKAFKALQRRAP